MKPAQVLGDGAGLYVDGDVCAFLAAALVAAERQFRNDGRAWPVALEQVRDAAGDVARLRAALASMLDVQRVSRSVSNLAGQSQGDITTRELAARWGYSPEHAARVMRGADFAPSRMAGRSSLWAERDVAACERSLGRVRVRSSDVDGG